MEKDGILLDIEDDLGTVILSRQITPGIYYISAASEEGTIPCEYYIARKECPELSQEAKRYGKPLEHHPEYLCYPASTPDNGRMVIEYEAFRYLKKHGLPYPEVESLLTITDYGREYAPEYFGDYPAPLTTPRGVMLKYITLISGVFLIETDELEKVLAVCYPIWSSELSDYTKAQGELVEYDLLRGIDNTEGYLYFTERSACLALFELRTSNKKIEQSGRINERAMMNAIWAYHPAYATSHNLREQAGLNDGLAELVILLDVAPERRSTDNVIPVFEGAGTDYLNI